jgi:O-antigen/teichoic acid export membrane protein
MTMLALSHILAPSAFGLFTLINTNALALQVLFGSSLVAIANRAMVSDDDEIKYDVMTPLCSCMLAVISLLLVGGTVYASIGPSFSWTAFAIATLTSTFIIYDTALAVQNAAGRESAYASFAIYRNLLVFLLAVGSALLGSGPSGPVIALLLGTTIPLVALPSARSIWLRARPSWTALARLRPYVGQGLSGALVLGLYILVNAPTRNIMAVDYGESVSGAWTLCADLFYGPLAVIGNAYALSHIRMIYLAARDGNNDAMGQRTRELMEFTLAIAIPYAIGCYFFAAEISQLILSHDQARLTNGVAVPAAIQGGVILVLYSLTSIVLAQHRYAVVAAMVLSSCAAAMMGTLIGANGNSAATGAVVASGGVAITWLAWSMASGVFQIRWRELAKLLVAAASLTTVASLILAISDFAYAWIAAAAASAITYVVVALTLQLAGFIDALPSGLQRCASRREAQDDR